MISEREFGEAVRSLRAALPSRIRVIALDTVDSTNTYAKELAKKGDGPAFVIARSQFGGRGRLGRSFDSPSGAGIYLSYLFKPGIPCEMISTLTPQAALAVSECVDRLTGARTGVKWVNDVYLGGKKICGILTEGSISPEGEIDYAIVGIGINLYKRDFGPLSGIASDVESESGVRVDFEKALTVLAGALCCESEFDACEYRRRSIVIGCRVLVKRGEECYEAQALDVNSLGHLIVRDDKGDLRELSSGEISIKVIK